MKKIHVFWGMAFFFFALSSCFHGRQDISVIGHRDNRVFLKKNLFFRVGELPSSWKKFNTKAKAVAFHNKALGATISVDAFCGGSFEDLPLKTLSGQMFAGVSNRQISKEKDLTLDGRGALRTIGSGAVDGVSLEFDSVVLKKNNCTIDFVYMSPSETYKDGVIDFEKFYNGFSFR